MPKFEYDFPEGFCVVRDTREQKGLFVKPPRGLMIIREPLPLKGLQNRWGDYSIKGFEDVVMVECKEIDDLWSSLTVKKEEFSEKLLSLATYERKYLLVLGLESQTLSWREHREIHPNQIRWAIAGIVGNLGLPIHFTESTSMAERWLLDWFIKFYKMKRNL